MKSEAKINVFIYFGLTIFTILLFYLPIGPNGIFGSEGDWQSQHVAIADTIRKLMAEQNTIIPTFSTLGGGSNIYDFAYYGLLRPDIIFGYLFPKISMTLIISVYSILGIIFSCNLCYFWLRKWNHISQNMAILGSILLVTSASFFQSHHQIMFVNYMPFLILALIGVDKLIKENSIWLLTFSVFMIYIHSFFYSISCIFFLFVYFLYKSQGKWQWKKLFNAAVAVILSTAMAAILLIPTGLDILSTTKDAGAFNQETLKLIDFSFYGLLYSTYSCGMTLLSLYTLFFSLKHKNRRLLAIIVIICITVPAIAFALNGFLYPRVKILMPLLPILALIAASSLEEIYEKKEKPHMAFLIICLLPIIALESRGMALAAIAETFILALWILILKFFREKKAAVYISLLLILLIPLGNIIMVNHKEEYLEKNDPRISRFSDKTLSNIVANEMYRYDALANNYMNSNIIANGNINKTAMYSSITNSTYASFYYDTMKNPIRLRNRVVLMPNQNMFFNYFMGIRYIMADADYIPPGYESKEENNGYVLAENENVLPMFYGTNKLFSYKDYASLTYPQNMEALTSSAIVNDSSTVNFNSKIKRVDLSAVKLTLDTLITEDGVKNHYKKVIKVPKSEKSQWYLIDFDVKSNKKKEVLIKINGVENLLSSETAPYPNNNNRFTFIFPMEKGSDTIEIELSKGKYSIENFRTYAIDSKNINHEDITIPQLNKDKMNKKSIIFSGEINMAHDGYFITSLPIKKGFQVTVDEKSIAPEKVNEAFLGFPLSSGKHEIEIKFYPPGYNVSKGISVFGIICFFIILILAYKRNHKTNSF